MSYFKPIKAVQSQINDSSTRLSGQLIYTSDTKKLYVDDEFGNRNEITDVIELQTEAARTALGFTAIANKLYFVIETNKLWRCASDLQWVCLNQNGVQISTDIATDSGDDTKAASPKAVKTYVDSRVSSAYTPAGSVAFAALPSPSVSNVGKVYNVTNEFTTTASFLEGAGHVYPAGTNVVVVNTSGSTYQFDVLSGFIDLSGYVQTADLAELTTTEVQALWDSVFTS